VKVTVYVLLILLSLSCTAAVFDLDHAVFRGDRENDVVEVYLLIPRNLFEFNESDDGYRSNVFVRVALVSDDSVRQLKEWSFSDRIDNLDQITNTQKIPDITTLTVPKGEYRIITVIMDLNSQKTYREEMKLNARDFSFDQLELSDIQLSSQIAHTNEKNKFSKYFNYDIIPNASNIYGEQNPMIYAFCEVYNLTEKPAENQFYQVRYTITDLNDNIMVQDGWMQKTKPGKSAVEIKGVSISTLRSGLYNFKVEVKEENSETVVVGNKRFYVAKNDQDKLLQETLAEINLAGMSEEQLDEMFDPLKYYATDKERRSYRKANVDGKRNIILNFWKGRDPDPSTEINEAQFSYQNRLQYVNEQFRTHQREGWKTDMGRIYLIYGEPSEIERFPSSLETKPYQIWYYYEIEGGVYFVFVDKSGFGLMELVHSTARNELQDESWQRWIRPTSDSSPSGFY